MELTHNVVRIRMETLAHKSASNIVMNVYYLFAPVTIQAIPQHTLVLVVILMLVYISIL